MFSNSKCIGRFCPPSLEKINVKNFVKTVVLVPYIETISAFYIKTMGGSLYELSCYNQTPFDCGEEALNLYKINEKHNITHIFLMGDASADTMLIFIKLLETKLGKGFLKVDLKLNIKYSKQVQHVLDFNQSHIKKLFIQHKNVGIHHILSQLEGKDLTNFCRSGEYPNCNQYVINIIREKDENFPIPDNDEDLYDFYVILHESNYNIVSTMRKAAGQGKENVVKLILSKSKLYMDFAMEGAIEGNDGDIVNYLIDEEGYHNFEYALTIAAKNKEMDLARVFLDKMLEKDEDYDFGLDSALEQAAYQNDKQIIDMILENGKIKVDIDFGLGGAAEGGHLELVKFFIKRGGEKESAIFQAAKGGHQNVIDYLLNDQDIEYDWNDALTGAAEGGHRDLVDLFIEKGADNMERGLEAAASGCHKELVQFFINRGAVNWRGALASTNRKTCKELYDFFKGKIEEQREREVEGERRDEERRRGYIPIEEGRILPRIPWLEE